MVNAAYDGSDDTGTGVEARAVALALERLGVEMRPYGDNPYAHYFRANGEMVGEFDQEKARVLIGSGMTKEQADGAVAVVKEQGAHFKVFKE